MVGALVGGCALAGCTSAAPAPAPDAGSTPVTFAPPAPVTPPPDSGFVATGPYAESASSPAGGVPATQVALPDGGISVQVQIGGSTASATGAGTYWVLTLWLSSKAFPPAAQTYTGADLIPDSASLSISSEEAVVLTSIPDGGDQQISLTLRPNPAESSSDVWIFDGTFTGTFDLLGGDKQPAGIENIAATF